MRPAHAIAAGAVAAAFVGSAVFLKSGASVPKASPTPTPVIAGTPKSQCDAGLWAHVYPGDTRRFKTPQDRLKVINDCITVTGVLYSSKPEKDGDLHIRLTVDPEFESLLNDKNKSAQMGKLVIEPVCQNAPVQKDTVEEKSCNGFTQKLDIPAIGTRVSVTGPYVIDQEHGWCEIHYVQSIRAIQ